MESPRKGVAMATDNRASEHDSTTNPALAVHVSQLVKRYGDMVALD
ncbi:MAG: ABC transporter ATP-binding protein, partial [Bifidobacterium breve]